MIVQSVGFAAALLFLIGLWTPIAGMSIAILELCSVVSRTTDVENAILLGTVAGALALLGPGARSVDAKLYGRKRIQIRLG